MVAADPAPGRLSHPARILYLFLAMPAMAFLGLTLASAGHVLYPTYAQVEGTAGALADQQLAGALMWGGSMLLIVPALGVVVLGLDASRRARGATDRRAPGNGRSDGLTDGRKTMTSRDRCIRCGGPVAEGSSVCNRCNPAHLPSPSSTQYHATVFLVVVATLVLTVAWLIVRG